MFPNDFLWGAAAAGYQVERPAGNADWDVFVNTQEIRDRVAWIGRRALDGAVINYVNPGPGIGHEDLEVIKADLDRARALKMTAYRFSVEWNRVQPTPPPFFELLRTGPMPLRPDPLPTPAIDQRWLDHYLNVVGEIAARGMTPVISLNHMTLPAWVMTPPAATRLVNPFVDLPTAAEDDQFNASLRGWENDVTVRLFAGFAGMFAREVKQRFGDLRPIWLTLNEPIGSMVGAGYLGGIWSPGFVGEGDRAKRVMVNLVRAHVMAYDAIKVADATYRVGFAHAMLDVTPTTFSSPLAGFLAGAAGGAGIGGAVGGGVGALGLGVLGAIIGCCIGLFLGPIAGLIGLVIGFLVGVIVGAILGAIAGAVVGLVVGALVGLVVGGAQNVQQRAADQFDYWNNDWLLRAVAKAEIDLDVAVGTTRPDSEWDSVWEATLPGIPRRARLDVVGINYYRRAHILYQPAAAWTVGFNGGVLHNNMEGDADPHGVLNELGWEVFPAGLSTLVRRVKRDYDLPVLITENGLPEREDANRAPNVVAHLSELHSVLSDPDPPTLWGYLHWTLVDNWEWHEGYNPPARFGLFTTGDRTDPANHVPGPAGAFKRQLTEGALAVRGVIENLDPAPALSRFGQVTRGGEQTSVPDHSNGALWTDGFIGGQLKLFLDSSGNSLTGLLYHGSENRWLPLTSVQWAESNRTLTLTHQDGTPAQPATRTITLALDPSDHRLAGTTTLGGTVESVQLFRDQLHGVWLPLADNPWLAVAFHGLEDGPPVGKVLAEGERRRWHAVGVTVGPPASLQVGPLRFQMGFASDPRELDIASAGLTGPPTRFRRAPSSLGFLGEQ